MSSNSVGGMEEYDEISGRNRTPTPEPVVVKIKPWEAAHDLRVSERSSELKASDEEIKKISKGVLKEHSVPEGRFSSFTPHALKKDVMTVTYKEPSYLSWLGFGKKHDIEVSLNMDQAEKLEKYRDLKELSKV